MTAIQNVRRLAQAALILAAIAWAGEVPRYLGLYLFTEQFLAVALALTFSIALLHAAEQRKGVARAAIVLLAAAGFAAGLYLAWNYQILSMVAALRPPDLVIVSTTILLAVVVATYLTSGLGITIVIAAFLAYGAFGHLLSGEERAYGIVRFDSLVVYLGADPNGMLGVALQVAATIVIAFILFGQFLTQFGAADFFTDLASALMGRYRGGSGKIAVVASALFGTISGSAVGNVVATGVVTIPLMKRGGFPADKAGAIEAVASTGGQLVPPVMGAAVFLMAELLRIPYSEVMLAALIPGLLYYVSIFIQVDLLAARLRIHAVPADQIPPLRKTLKSGWHFILPFVVLVYALFFENMRPERAALLSTLVLIVVGYAFGYRGQRPGLLDMWRSIVDAGNMVKDLVIICAAAGIVIGVLNLSGLAFGLTLHLVAISGENVIVLLLLTAAVSTVLGMGMPTVGVYVLLATLVAPALVRAGVPELSAHLFVLYFGLLSMVTPPVGLAAFAAANIAEANPWRTCWSAVLLGWSAYIVPFLFIASPRLLMQGPPLGVVWTAATAIAGVFAVCVGLVGILRTGLSPTLRLAFGVTGVLLLIPADAYAGALYTDLAGLAGLALLLMLQLLRRGAADMRLSAD